MSTFTHQHQRGPKQRPDSDYKKKSSSNIKLGVRSKVSPHKTTFNLTDDQYSVFSHISEMVPDWTPHAVHEFCRKYNYDPEQVENGVFNMLEDKRVSHQLDEDWTQVTSKKKKEDEKPVETGDRVTGHQRRDREENKDKRPRQTEASTTQHNSDPASKQPFRGKKAENKPTGPNDRATGPNDRATGPNDRATGPNDRANGHPRREYDNRERRQPRYNQENSDNSNHQNSYYYNKHRQQQHHQEKKPEPPEIVTPVPGKSFASAAANGLKKPQVAKPAQLQPAQPQQTQLETREPEPQPIVPIVDNKADYTARLPPTSVWVKKHKPQVAEVPASHQPKEEEQVQVQESQPEQTELDSQTESVPEQSQPEVQSDSQNYQPEQSPVDSSPVESEKSIESVKIESPQPETPSQVLSEKESSTPSSPLHSSNAPSSSDPIHPTPIGSAPQQAPIGKSRAIAPTVTLNPQVNDLLSTMDPVIIPPHIQETSAQSSSRVQFGQYGVSRVGPSAIKSVVAPSSSPIPASTVTPPAAVSSPETQHQPAVVATAVPVAAQPSQYALSQPVTSSPGQRYASVQSLATDKTIRPSQPSQNALSTSPQIQPQPPQTTFPLQPLQPLQPQPQPQTLLSGHLGQPIPASVSTQTQTDPRLHHDLSAQNVPSQTIPSATLAAAYMPSVDASVEFDQHIADEAQSHYDGSEHLGYNPYPVHEAGSHGQYVDPTMFGVYETMHYDNYYNEYGQQPQFGGMYRDRLKPEQKSMKSKPFPARDQPNATAASRNPSKPRTSQPPQQSPQQSPQQPQQQPQPQPQQPQQQQQQQQQRYSTGPYSLQQTQYNPAAVGYKPPSPTAAPYSKQAAPATQNNQYNKFSKAQATSTQSVFSNPHQSHSFQTQIYPAGYNMYPYHVGYYNQYPPGFSRPYSYQPPAAPYNFAHTYSGHVPSSYEDYSYPQTQTQQGLADASHVGSSVLQNPVAGHSSAVGDNQAPSSQSNQYENSWQVSKPSKVAGLVDPQPDNRFNYMNQSQAQQQPQSQQPQSQSYMQQPFQQFHSQPHMMHQQPSYQADVQQQRYGWGQ